MDNLVSLLTKLSEQLLLSDGEDAEKGFNDCDRANAVKIVRQKALDVIRNYRQNPFEKSSVWYPEILVTDYAYELLQKGAEASSSLLFKSIGALEDSDVDFRDTLTFLLDLKGPFVENACTGQHPFSLSGTGYFFSPSDPFQLLPKELTCGVIDNSRDAVKTTPDRTPLLLERFIDSPKKETVVRSLPLLQNFVDDDDSLVKIKKEPTPGPRLESLPKARPISPWSDHEREILDGTEFAEEVREEQERGSFLAEYSEKLNGPLRNPFKRQDRKRGRKQNRGLALSMFAEEEHLQSLIEPTIVKAYQKIDLQNFISQLKYLLLGADSEIFKFDTTENKYFMKCGLYIDDLPPDCLFQVSQPFLECGTFFRNLSDAVDTGRNLNLGVIYPAFWSSVSVFLQDYCKSVVDLSTQDISLLMKMPASKLYTDLATVYRLCFPRNGELPPDGRFMSYLFEYSASMRPRSVVFAIIYDCCVVYFSKLLQKWLFQGLLDDKNPGGFFICKNSDEISVKDRLLYGSVIIIPDNVPCFLRNLAQKIFSCGKAIWLLKLCDSENNFIFYTETKLLPKLRICLTETEFSVMEREFKNYEENILSISGEAVTFKTLRQAEELKTTQLIEFAKLPILQRDDDVGDVSNKSEMVMVIEEEKKVCEEYYRKLSRDAEELKELADWKGKRYQLHERRVEFFKQDFMNDNAVFDNEGNLIVPTEADVENANIVLEKNRTNSPRKTDNEAVQNKSKIMGTTLFDDNVNKPKSLSTEAMKNKMKILGLAGGYKDDDEEEARKTKNVTDAMRNKMKILGSEYGDNAVETDGSRNLNNSTMSEAMKNKLKSLGAEFYDYSEEKILNNQRPLTEAMKNKLKVLGTEYGLVDETEKRDVVMTAAVVNKNRVMGSEIGKLEPESPVLRETSDARLTEAQKNKMKMMRTDIDFSLPDNVVQVTPKKIDTDTVVVEEAVVAVSELTLNKVNIFEPLTARVNLLDFPESNEKPCFDHMDMITFSRLVQRSLLVALNVQERLANSSVLKHFLVNENLMAHLTSLRCFFLLNDGEFSRSLTYGLFHLLVHSTEPHYFFDASSLSGILNEALNCAHHGSQTNIQNVSFQILKIPKKLDKQSHDVLHPFQLSYKVAWPMNIIVTEPILLRYRKVFHVLVNLKRVHWILNETFLQLKTQTKDHVLDGKLLMKSPEYTRLATYRHAMTLFIMTLEEHLSTNGLQEAWNNFMKQLETVGDLDHLYQKHVEFVKDVCRRCFVSRSCLLLSYINEFVELGLNFHATLKSSTWRLMTEDQYSHPKFSELKAIFEKFCKTTNIFTKALSKKSQTEESSIHNTLLELINLKIKF